MSYRNSLKTGSLFPFRRPNILFALVVLMSVSPVARAVEQDLLWLPRNYNHHYKTLYRAAVTVEEHDRCAKVIAASLSEAESNIEHPVFKITCRDKARISFVAVVDGFTNEILNLPPSLSEEPIELEPEIELSPEEAAEEAHQNKLNEHWQFCFSQVERRAQKLHVLEWLHEGQSEPVEESETALLYHVDFNARTENGEALAFRAHCEFGEGEKNIEIHARNLPGVIDREASDDEMVEDTDVENLIEGNGKDN